MVFEKLLDPVMSPLLNLNPFVSVLLVSLIISFLVTIIYKYTTNQNLMKQLRDELKDLQKEMKALKDNPKKMMEINRKAMETNMKYMMQSFRSTLFTFIPIIIIFSWMNANYAFNPIEPNTPFQITLQFDKNTIGNASVIPPSGIEVVGEKTQQINADKAIFTLKGKEGDYSTNNSIKFEYDNKYFYKDVLLTNGPKYYAKDTIVKNSDLKVISANYQKKIILPFINWGWLGTYIIFSIVFSMILRKVMKVY